MPSSSSMCSSTSKSPRRVWPAPEGRQSSLVGEDEGRRHPLAHEAQALHVGVAGSRHPDARGGEELQQPPAPAAHVEEAMLLRVGDHPRQGLAHDLTPALEPEMPPVGLREEGEVVRVEAGGAGAARRGGRACRRARRSRPRTTGTRRPRGRGRAGSGRPGRRERGQPRTRSPSPIESQQSLGPGPRRPVGDPPVRRVDGPVGEAGQTRRPVPARFAASPTRRAGPRTRSSKRCRATGARQASRMDA